MENVNIENIDSSTESLKAKILVIEDQPITLKMIKKNLLESNYSVTAVTNGEDAICMASTAGDYDIVILDIMLPQLSGYDVCRRLRESYSLFELPILFLTAKNSLDDKIQGFDAGANDFLPKPYEKSELLARVKTLIKLKRLTQSNAVLQEAIEMKNLFFQMYIHDLKNPLMTIIFLANLMKVDAYLKSEQKDNLATIANSANTILNLVNEILELSKIESGKIVLKKSPVNFTEIVSFCVSNNKQLAERKSQNLVFRCDPQSSYMILADPEKIQQVVDNLVDNAIKYSRNEKTIWVDINSPAQTSTSNIVRLEVRDEGPGLTEEDIGKMFNKFQRLSAKPTAGESSTGLGLSIVKHLVDLHDGKIWVESQPGYGTKFIVEFQLYKPLSLFGFSI